ncbi:hypothetical protein NQ176_g10527 [Zarea fungicola]|uniref:Uncharacterized protein n=1 Tax=Zarea fungicola TaxID=93591 RepID=A0ACC1MH71_9HYPO|nr:hypothetical protein NQ176_g10527 [Lecanicillium fungicola]
MPGFAFTNYNRNAALHSRGVPLPKATSTGTTIVGCIYDGGVVIAADTRATSGPIVADKNCEKLRQPLFATAGRDKQIRIWSGKANGDGKVEFTQKATLSSNAPVTAVDFLTSMVDGKFVLAFGTENGVVSTYLVSADGTVAKELPLSSDKHLPKSVLQLAWRPLSPGKADGLVAELAVAGEDASLRLYSFPDGFLKDV